MTASTDGVGFQLTGLIAGTTYTGVISFWAESAAPNVAAAIDNDIFGAVSSRKQQDGEVRVNFEATGPTHFLSLNPMSASLGGAVWVSGFYCFESSYSGNLFTGASPTVVTPPSETGELTIAGMMVQILANGVTPQSGPFISGQGNAGCEFEKLPNMTPYNKPLDRVGMSATLIETGPWL